MGGPKYHETLTHEDIKPMQITFYSKYILNIYFISEENITLPLASFNFWFIFQNNSLCRKMA